MTIPRIGIMIIPTDPFWVLALEAIIHTSQKIGCELAMLHPAATLDDFFAIPPDELVDQVLAYDLDALICTIVTDTVLHAFVDAGLPVICLAELEYHHPLFTALSSLYTGGSIAGQYIGQRLGGTGNVLCVTAGKEKIPITGKSRLEGFRFGLKPFTQISVEHIPVYWSYPQAHSALLDFFANYTKHIDAIFGVSDTIILAARDAARECGRIDKSTVLVGLNGDPMALSAVAEGELDATVDTASENVGAMAINLAYKAALGEALPDLINFRYQLITHDNVANLATRKLAEIADIPSHLVGYNREQERDRLSQLEISTQITRQIGSLQDRNRLIQVISEVTKKYFGYDSVRILRWSEKEHKLDLYAASASPDLMCLPIENDHVLQKAFDNNEVINIPDTRSSRRRQINDDWGLIRSRAMLPIQLGSDVIGVLDLQSSKPIRQPSLEIVGLKLLASQLGIVLQNADLYLEAIQAKEDAERANQLKTRLIVNVGHEMRTPLNSILGFSQSIQKQLIEDSSPNPGRLAQDVQKIYKSGEHLMYIINDILDLSRAEIGALSLYFESLQPVQYLKELFESFVGLETQKAKVSWILEIPERLPVIRVDNVRLRQILINLLVNAAKYTQEGSITLGAAVEPPYLHLWVKDTGQGVPIELQEKIFEPFGVVGRKRRPEGIGLGLSITRHLVALHNGLITLESKPGIGSTFNIYLPLPGLLKEPLLSPSTEREPILIVISRSNQIPKDILQICEGQGLKAFVACNQDELWLALRSGSPVAIAWDMQHASSAEWIMIQQISMDQNCRALPMIIFGQDSGSFSNGCGLTHVIFKPTSNNTIKDWIEQIVPDMKNGNSLLVVDDDEYARTYYKKVLENYHPQSQIILAENGKRALDVLQDVTPALILLDLMMPEMDGFTLLEKIRSNPQLHRVPVVIISGKLLNYEDIQRLDYLKTYLLTKEILSMGESTDFLNQIDGNGKSLPQPTSKIIKQVLAYLQQNYTCQINRRDIADEVGVSENYLSQIFRQEITITPWDYLTRYRVQKAKYLLQNTSDSITQISAQVGFNDSAYFSRVFRKIMGQSPQDFRSSDR
ncbi:MAG: helix-turn-helix domain-containing protein [Anaerolineaceae bacterium]|nr:helix-turn-helix domain-containing protein [Anaerolineaceae bacterium]